jgi:hypothetical protein
MRLYAIADPHLSSVVAKPMSVFGGAWSDHPDVLLRRWRETVREDDTVIVAGDISWALKLEDALPDLAVLADLPGKKILLRGNHDYWWPSISKLRAALPTGMFALQNDSIVVGQTAIVGTRGWACPGSEDFKQEDEKIYLRELERLRLAIRTLQGQSFKRVVVALHYPPVNARFEANGFTEILEALDPTGVVFGHLHGVHPGRVPRDWKGIPFHFVSCDGVGFRPQLLLEKV